LILFSHSRGGGGQTLHAIKITPIGMIPIGMIPKEFMKGI
jgi:hypothetical protein